MRPFLLLASRAEDVAADGEHDAVLRFAGLRADQLHRVRMEAGPLPAIALDDYSGVIVGGSPFDSSRPDGEKSDVQRRVERELAPLLDEIVDRDFPFLGACYGVGTLGLHEGAVVDETFGEEIGAVTIRLTDAGRADPLLADVPDEFEAYVGHKEAVTRLPPHAVLLASSDTCPVQMFRFRENLYATQFHPELDLDGILTRIGVYKEYGYFPPETAADVETRVRGRDVHVPHTILTTFVRRYARA
ncbi:glutamine amidotransferase [Cellulosimicrobium arenosum]|uniref:Glutamine amidotransferase n=1 Tax=Cellulosimicrobium arenosum TaxID=2708133 RepID=A0A927J0V6_9MICO|nr:glutamine amidotransferase [Cellulosimicrobium arenosum]MBD8079740.1 glutamine amidotransferase [Cellulosimicrobium arenosum]